MPNYRIAAVVVTYNRRELLSECINALLGQTAAGCCDIIVVDNNSTDGTRESLEGYINNGSIIYLNTGENLGGAGGFNYGMRYAAENGYTHVWVMDDDAIPYPDALEKFLEFDSEHEGEYGFLSGRVLWSDGSSCITNVQRRTLTRNVRSFGRKAIRISMASFVSLFVPVSILYEHGLPIREFFIWTDDWEFTRRISREHPCYLITSSKVIHKTQNNDGSDIAQARPDELWKYRLRYRNDVYLYRREGIRGAAYEAVRLPAHAARIMRKSSCRRESLKAVICGTIDGFRFRPQPEYPEKRSDRH